MKHQKTQLSQYHERAIFCAYSLISSLVTCLINLFQNYLEKANKWTFLEEVGCAIAFYVHYRLTIYFWKLSNLHPNFCSKSFLILVFKVAWNRFTAQLHWDLIVSKNCLQLKTTKQNPANVIMETRKEWTSFKRQRGMNLSQKAEHRLSYTVVFLDLLSLLFLLLENSLLLSLSTQKEKFRWRPYSNLLETKCIYFCNRAFFFFFFAFCIHSVFSSTDWTGSCLCISDSNKLLLWMYSGFILICSILFIELFIQIHQGLIPGKVLA